MQKIIKCKNKSGEQIKEKKLTREVNTDTFPQPLVVFGPVMMLDMSMGGDCLHPLGVMVDELSCRSSPLLAKATDDKGLVLHGGPFTLEAWVLGGNTRVKCVCCALPSTIFSYSQSSLYMDIRLLVLFSFLI